jgi:aminoglycoside phosphotransferase (APT) family kinase protein
MPVDLHALFASAPLGDVVSSTPLSGGFSGATTLAVTTSTGSFIVKHMAHDEAAFRRTIALQRLAAEAGVAPTIVHVDAARFVTITPKIEGTSLFSALASPELRPRVLGDLAARLRTLHAIPIPVDFEHHDGPAAALAIWRSQASRPGFPAWALGLGAEAEEAGALLAKDGRRVLGHGDLHPANVLWDGARTWLLDWERCGPAHPYMDLATLATFALLPDEAALGLLAMQEGGAIDATERARFQAARARARIIYGAVFLTLVPDLGAVELGAREDLATLAECFAQIREGKIVLGTPAGHAAVGAALLRG